MQEIEAAGIRVSRIGLGTWQFGSREWGYGETYLRETAPALLRRAVELGITLIDTAEAYGPGRSELVIGETLASMAPDVRSQLIVATKFMPIAPLEGIVARQAAGSRRRLQVDDLDLYYAHWPNPFVSARRVMQSLRPLVDAGLVRRVGVSNYSLEDWQAAEAALGAPVVANQVRFSLIAPGPARALVPWAAGHDRLVVAYSPIGQGMLAGDPTDAPTDAPVRGFRALNRGHAARVRARIAPLIAVVGDVARAHAATPAQVALAWVLHHPNTVAIVGARTVAQLEENAAAADLALDDAELDRLTQAAFEAVDRPGTGR